MKKPYDIYDGCTNCPHLHMCSEVEVKDGGYAQGGYTFQDEYGDCPDEFMIEEG